MRCDIFCIGDNNKVRGLDCPLLFAAGDGWCDGDCMYLKDENYEWVEDHKDELLTALDNGDWLARNIINVYRMLALFPEQCSYAILECSIENWKKRETKTNVKA